MPTPPTLRRAALALTLLASGLLPAPRALAVEHASGVVFTAGVGGGAELGLDHGKAGVAETELALGWEHAESGLRPELAVGLGLAPDGHVALRPGVRWTLPDLPIQLRAALDWSNARDETRWRWLLAGAAVELRWTSSFSLYAGLDLGVPLGADAGMPVLARGGAAFRF